MKLVQFSRGRIWWKRDVPKLSFPTTLVQQYSKKKPAEDKLVPPLWGTRGKNVCFSRIICSRCCTRRNLRFDVENCQHADQKQLTRR